jgi:LysM domain
MTRIISVLFFLFSNITFTAHAASTEPLELSPDAPKRHVVVRGDTLWDISGLYLKNPFRWPELWGFNKDKIKNPHWIYPGQVLVLRYFNGQPRLCIEGEACGDDVSTEKLEPRIRITDGAQAISAIPAQVIEPFLSQPLVVEEDALGSAPRIVATQHNRVISGDNDLAYATGLKPGQKSIWQIFRPGKVLKDPVSNEVIGHEAVFLGTAKLVKDGDPATLRIVNVRQETGKDDRLVLAPPPDIINYPMHKPTTDGNSRVVSIYGDSNAGGQYSIVAISGGKKTGLEPGHVLALSRTGLIVTDRYKGSKRDIALPDERYGMLYVFRTFQKVSYALVMEASQPVEVGDSAGTP